MVTAALVVLTVVLVMCAIVATDALTNIANAQRRRADQADFANLLRERATVALEQLNDTTFDHVHRP